MKLNELTIPDLSKSSLSNITSKALTIRYNDGDSHIELDSAHINLKKGFMELTFSVNSTFGNTSYIAATDVPHDKDGVYSVVLRFYGITNYIKKDFGSLPLSQMQKALEQVIQNCDVKFYSDDPSYFYQAAWEDGEKANIAIYKFPGEKGDGTWHDRHAQSGGLQNSYVHLTKHMGQIISQIKHWIPEICKNVEIQ